MYLSLDKVSILAAGLFYVIQVYGIAAKTHLNRLCALQRIMLRKITTKWYMRSRVIETISRRWKKISREIILLPKLPASEPLPRQGLADL